MLFRSDQTTQQRRRHEAKPRAAAENHHLGLERQHRLEVGGTQVLRQPAGPGQHRTNPGHQQPAGKSATAYPQLARSMAADHIGSGELVGLKFHVESGLGLRRGRCETAQPGARDAAESTAHKIIGFAAPPPSAEQSKLRLPPPPGALS